MWFGVGSLLVLGLAAACGDSTDGSSSGAAGDGGAFDSGSTTTPGTDAQADTGGGADAGADTGADAGQDSGSDAGAVFASCKAALAANAAATTGLYTIDPDGAGPQGPIQVFCDMTNDGGGWTLGLLKNSVDNAQHATFGSGYVGLPALAVDPAVASGTAVGTPALAGWLDLNAFSYTEMILEGWAAGASKFRSAIIAKSTLRIPFGQNGYYLYDDANGYYWCGGASSYTDNGAGQVNPPAGAPTDCKGHTSLGDGWDFGSASPNSNLTACGGGSALMKAGPAEGFVGMPTPGAAHAFWVR